MPISLRSKCFTYAVIASVFGASLALAQTAPSGTTAGPKTVTESAREKRKALEAEAAQKQQRREAWDKRTLETIEARNRLRTECRKQASEQNLRWLKRARFIRNCMASGSPR